MRVRGAEESRGAVVVAADGGDGGKAEQTFGREGADDQLAAEPELLAERVASSVGVAGQQRGQPEVATQDHPDEGIVESRARAGSRARRSPCVAIAAVAQRPVGGGGEQIREVVDVADVVQQRGGAVDALAKLGDAGRRHRFRAATPRDRPVVARGARPVKRLVGEASATSSRPAVDLVMRRGLERLARGSRVASPGDRLRLGHDRGLLGRAPQRPQDRGLDAEGADASAGWASAPGRLSAWSIQSSASA